MRTLTASLVSLAVLTAPVSVQAQTSVVGGLAGRVTSVQLRERGDDSAERSGFLVGAYVDVVTPTPLLHVLAEASYVQRGGRLALTGTGEPVGDVQADYLMAVVAPSLRVGVGPVALVGYAGPVVEFPLRTRSVAELGNLYATPNEQVFSVTAGAGLEGDLGSWIVRGEVRMVRQLSSAYANLDRDIKHRSTEILVRLGRPRPR